MNNNNLTHNDGLVSDVQELTHQPKVLKKTTFFLALVFGGFASLTGLGLVCVLNGGYVDVQVQELVLTFSGQPKSGPSAKPPNQVSPVAP